MIVIIYYGVEKNYLLYYFIIKNLVLCVFEIHFGIHILIDELHLKKRIKTPNHDLVLTPL